MFFSGRIGGFSFGSVVSRCLLIVSFSRFSLVVEGRFFRGGRVRI